MNFSCRFGPDLLLQDKMKHYIGLAVALIVLMQSCTINKNVMFKTDQDFVFNQPPVDSLNSDYRLSPNDFIAFKLFTNEGAIILEFTTSSTETPRYFNFQDFTYIVDKDGYVDFPTLGRTFVEGLTINEIQDLLEEKYSNQFNSPFAIVRVINRRVIVFPGTGSSAAVVPLVNQNTTVIEALALAGGLAERANASKVKLIRKVNDKNEIYLMNLSTIEGIREAQMIVQANDVIYVEPVPELASEALKDIAPYVSIVSGIALIYAIFARGF